MVNLNEFQGPAFAGLHKLLNTTSELPCREDVDDDIEGEQETIPDLHAEDLEATEEADKEGDLVSQWRESIMGASKGVTDKTDGEYQRSVDGAFNCTPSVSYFSIDWQSNVPLFLYHTS